MFTSPGKRSRALPAPLLALAAANLLLVSLQAQTNLAPAVEPARFASPNTQLNERELQIIAAAKPEAKPRINGARIIGVRPRTPFLYKLAVSGQRPITFSVPGLPAGLWLDSKSGTISGRVESAGELNFNVKAVNAAGQALSSLRILCGENVALLPPMGWNSYDAFGDSVREDEVLTNARWLDDHLQPLGWNTVVVDFRWYDALADGLRVQNPEGVLLDPNGRCLPPTNRFPSAANNKGFAPLAATLHSMGLKFGIHIMRGIPRQAVEQDLPIAGSTLKASQAARPEGDPNRTCPWNRDMYGVDVTSPAGRAWYASIAQQYAAWGVDYIKCDDIGWLGQGRFYGAEEIETLWQALRSSGRSMVLSLSPGPAPLSASRHLKEFANLWRISGDFWDNWPALNENFDLFAAWLPDIGPGHWADGDMIPFAHVCQRNCDVRPDRWTRFTRDEQLTLMTLWALAPSPLMLGMNLPDNDDWTTALLTNPDVLAINQDPLGKAARRMTLPQTSRTRGNARPAPPELWLKDLADGTYAIGLFNRQDQPLTVTVPWRFLGFRLGVNAEDLWIRRDLGQQAEFKGELPAHGCVLLRVKAM